MSDKNHDFTSFVCIYAQLLPKIRQAAKELGYALAIHGTLTRDLDLLAVPWIEDAAEPLALVNAIQQAVGGFVIGDLANRGEVSDKPTQQPHGRLSWNICWGGHVFIDLSIMPKENKQLRNFLHSLAVSSEVGENLRRLIAVELSR